MNETDILKTEFFKQLSGFDNWREKLSIKLEDRDPVAKCLDNNGIEDQFDLGADYIFVPNDTEAMRDGMIAVLDKLGIRRICLRSRFEVLSQPVDLLQMWTHWAENPWKMKLDELEEMDKDGNREDNPLMREILV